MTHPSFLYGTAWKDERTAALTRMAVEAGLQGRGSLRRNSRLQDLWLTCGIRRRILSEKFC